MREPIVAGDRVRSLFQSCRWPIASFGRRIARESVIEPISSGRFRRPLVYCVVGVLLITWALFVFDLWRTRGFFDWLGIDFGFFFAGARAFIATGPSSVYELSALATHLEPLGDYFGPHAEAQKVGPVPYPPIFVLLLTPLTLFSPPAAFLLWTLASLILATVVVRGLASRFQTNSWITVPLVLTFFPLAYSLLVGQVTIILLFAFYRAYRHLERAQDFQAGLWAGVLLLKPQYAACLILVLLVKRRWSALGGIAATGVAIALSSIVFLGFEGLISFYSSLRYATGFREVDLIVYPDHMIGWRGLLVNLLPGISEVQGMTLTLILTAITLIFLLVLWRGPWNPRGEQFAARLFATMAVTLLVSYHSHIHGGALLLVPGMAMVATMMAHG